MQADLIFKKLTGARKPRGHQLVSIALIKQEAEAKKNAKIQNLNLSKFLEALYLVGKECFAVGEDPMGAVDAMLVNCLNELDRQIQSSERG